MIQRHHRLALYMERAFEEKTGKLGLGVLRYSENDIVCLVDSLSVGKDLRGLTGIDHSAPVVASIQEAKRLGADVLVLGIAPPGGLVPDDWWPALDEAVSLGMSLVNGLHDKLGTRYPILAPSQFVWDVRTEPSGLGVGTAAARLMDNRRVLMIGTDMSVGKMTAGLELARSANNRGIRCSFVATGQTGMVITGSGIPLDAIRLDYASGAVEREVCKYSESEIVIIEGQGSLVHPGSSANLPLIRGSCPTHFVLCHRAGMESLPRIPWIDVPDLLALAKLYEDLSEACGVFPRAKLAALSLNTGHLSETDALSAIRAIHEETGIPACDPVRQGAEVLLESVLG